MFCVETDLCCCEVAVWEDSQMKSKLL